MKKVRYCLICVVLLCSCAFCFCQDQDAGGILYGRNWACMVSPPENWIMDQQSFARHGIYGLFYEKGKQLGPETPIIYINTVGLPASSDKALTEFIKSDIAIYTDKGADVSAVTLKDIKEKKVISYNIVSANSFEICAYTRYKNSCFFIVLAGNNARDVQGNITNLIAVINSMTFLDAVVAQ